MSILENSDLLDPKGIVSKERLHAYNEKIKIVRTLLTRSPKKGGNPFIYAFSMNKAHELWDVTNEWYVDPETDEKITLGTAATDGKKYFWHPDILDQLDPFALVNVMAHETYHMILQHCDPDRKYGKVQWAWAAAIDYIVHGMIEHDIRTTGRDDLPNLNLNSKFKGADHPLWKQGAAGAIDLEQLCENIKKAHKEKAALKAKGLSDEDIKKALNKKPNPDEVSWKNAHIYADYTVYGMSAEEVYRKIIEMLPDDMQDAAASMNPGLFGITQDEHIDIQMSREELLEEILEAATTCEKTAGSVPSAVKDKLAELQEPKLSWQDLVRSALRVRRAEKGSINDWSRYRRRPLSWNKEEHGVDPGYYPKKKDNFVSWLCMLDTSGSMSNEDMAFGVSQLKCLDGRSRGLVVPCDAQPYWEDAKEINGMKDLPSIKATGRGGTAFSQFFLDYTKRLGPDWDVVIILTDGGVWDLDNLPKPRHDVVWVLTNDCKGFNPPFGRVAPLRKLFRV